MSTEGVLPHFYLLGIQSIIPDDQTPEWLLWQNQ
jgi:hypothetical protein